MIRLALYSAACLLCIGAGCFDARVDFARASHEAVHRWLTCIECTDGELATVVMLARSDRANVVVGLLSKTLERGPAKPVRDNLRHQVLADWLMLGGAAGTGFTEASWLAIYETNVVRLMRSRGAIALAEIGTGAATDSLSAIVARDSVSAFLDPRSRAVATAAVLP